MTSENKIILILKAITIDILVVVIRSLRFYSKTHQLCSGAQRKSKSSFYKLIISQARSPVSLKRSFVRQQNTSGKSIGGWAALGPAKLCASSQINESQAQKLVRYVRSVKFHLVQTLVDFLCWSRRACNQDLCLGTFYNASKREGVRNSMEVALFTQFVNWVRESWVQFNCEINLIKDCSFNNICLKISSSSAERLPLRSLVWPTTGHLHPPVARNYYDVVGRR